MPPRDTLTTRFTVANSSARSTVKRWRSEASAGALPMETATASPLTSIVILTCELSGRMNEGVNAVCPSANVNVPVKSTGR